MKDWLGLLKLRITLASTITTGVGYVMARGQVDLPILPVMAGILLQACGAAALNQVQDAHIDVLMERTARRPIPAGRISRRAATLFALGLLAAGSVVLGFFGLAPMLLGLGAAVVYNLVYTPLKRVTPFAALPGALIGALPPVVGWSAAGGYLSDPSIHLVAFFFFIWQIPHFWLLLLFYHRDYADGGLPSLFDRFDRRQIVKLTFIWIAALAVSALLLPLVHLFDEVSLAYVVAAAGLLVVVRSLALLRVDVIGLASQGAAALQPFHRSCRIRFMEINTFALLVSAMLVVDALN
ncbi:protoheme IX farnesyltransferase [bacterium]|nr:protoheme IX farnesyltransferase [bacterium]